MSEEELESAKKEMEEILINELINFVRDGADPKSDKSAQMKCYNIVYNFTEKGFAANLLNYHNEKVTGITKEIYEKIKNLSGIDFIDSFILYTERLNALFFLRTLLYFSSSSINLFASVIINLSKLSILSALFAEHVIK